MYLLKSEISKLNLIEYADPDNFYSIGYDLRIRNIIFNTQLKDWEQPQIVDSYDLKPGTTVFVATEEDLKLPDNIIGFVIQKNSLIRAGLQIEAPVYQPGHHTKIFLRITNISSNIFKLQTGNRIAAIMFYRLSESAEHYSGSYIDEFDYKGVAEYPKDTLPQLIKVEERLNDIKDLEERLISKVVTIITIFIGIFTLLNINIKLVEQPSLWNLLVYNLISVGIIGFLIGFVGLLLKRSKKMLSMIFIISALLILFSFIVIYKFAS